MKSESPQPLFDNLANIEEISPPEVTQYMNEIDVYGVNDDFKHTLGFLKSYTGSEDTFNAYRREVERVIQWSWLIAKKPLPELDRHDLRDYIEFFQKPPISWISTQYFPRFHNTEGLRTVNKDWRPFVVRTQKAHRKLGQSRTRDQYQPSNTTIANLLACLSTFFSYLVQEEYIKSNPIQLLRQKSQYVQKKQNQRITRKLSSIQWSSVINTIEKMADENPKYERHLFIMTAFYMLGLRISELADSSRHTPTMGDFMPDQHGYWWLSTLSKGNKWRDIAVPEEMLTALKRYRISRNLTPLPQRNEQTSMLHKEKGRGGLGSRQIRNIVQTCFDAAIHSLQKANKMDEAQDLANATVHWLRHTAISADVEHRPREHVRDDAGHGNAMITDRYIDIDRQARHRSARDKRLKPDDLIFED